jgi:hypothetical protein
MDTNEIWNRDAIQMWEDLALWWESNPGCETWAEFYQEIYPGLDPSEAIGWIVIAFADHLMQQPALTEANSAEQHKEQVGSIFFDWWAQIQSAYAAAIWDEQYQVLGDQQAEFTTMEAGPEFAAEYVSEEAWKPEGEAEAEKELEPIDVTALASAIIEYALPGGEITDEGLEVLQNAAESGVLVLEPVDDAEPFFGWNAL